MQYIGLLDCNNFFVSCERLFRPDLLGKPVVVLSSNDGCVVARSQEVKDLGIPMGVPLFKVKDEFRKHKIVKFSSNFPLYRDISARVMSVLHEEVEKMEQYSVDEAFFTVSDKEDIVSFIANIKQKVEQKVGVPVSVGVAKTKTLAKVASHTAKKASGTYLLTDVAWQEMAKNIAIGEIWGVGGGLSQRYRGQGIETPADLLAADSAQIAKLFGVGGARLQSELRGQPAYALERKRTLQDSIMCSRSFKDAQSDLSKLERAVAYHVEHAAEQLREMHGLAGAISVRVTPSRFGDYAFQGIAGELELTEATDDTSELLSAALSVIHRHYQPNVPYKKAGVVLSQLTPKEQQVVSLFAEQSNRGELWQTVDKLRQKFGHQAVRMYSVDKNATLSAASHSSGSQTTCWEDIPTIKAN